MAWASAFRVPSHPRRPGGTTCRVAAQRNSATCRWLLAVAGASPPPPDPPPA